ncbi:hypothetical protein [Bacillus cereus]|uniref:hypothetical protein n=1 Tax=Bacillus cereus TaxID=1396 RepID=UPI000B7F5F16|nr:hypothetical protein [Bacillus cereus]
MNKQIKMPEGDFICLFLRSVSLFRKRIWTDAKRSGQEVPQGKIRLPWHEKANAFPCQGQTHSFLIRAALESKTSSASRVNGLQADFALRDFAFLEVLHQ